MATILDRPNIFGFVHWGASTGQSSSSSGTADFGPELYAVFPLPVPLNAVLNNVIENIKPGFNVYYKMQGFNPITQQYENWHCQGQPLFSPPSGNTLENVGIVGIWKDR